MATVPIRDILDNETGEPIFPRTHVKAVIGLADSNFFEEYVDGNGARSVKLRSDYVGLWAEGWISNGGIGAGGGGGGGGLINGVYGASSLGSIYSPTGTDDLTKTFSAFAIDKVWQSVLALQQSTPNVSLANGQEYSTISINGASAQFYTKSQVDGLLTGIHSFEPVPVLSLPAASADTMFKLYLVPSADPQSQNVKDEFITVRSGSAGNYSYDWEQIGSTAIDLTNYVTTQQLGSWAGSSNITTLGTISSGSIPLSLVTGASDLKAIEALTGTSGLLKKTAANTWTLDTTSYLPSGTTLDSIADGSTRKLADYLPLSGGTITGNLAVNGTASFGSTVGVSDAISLVGTTAAKRRIYFGDSAHYIELDSNGFHFSHGVYSDEYISVGGVGSDGGGGGVITSVYGNADLGSVYSAGGTEELSKTFSAFAIDRIWQSVVALQQSTPNVSLSNGSSYSTLTVNGTVAGFYTKTQVDSLLGAINAFDYVVASSLPTASADTMYKIYLIPSADPQTGNIKDEYITIRGGSAGGYTYSWEQIGSTSIDLSGYATKTWANQQFLKKTGGDISGDIFHQIEEEDVESGEISIYEIWKITENGDATFESLSVDGVDFSTINSRVNTLWNARNNYLPLAGGTMTGTITMSGANIFPSASHTCNIGASSAFFAGLYGDTIHAHALELYSSSSVQAFRLQGGIENAGTDNEVYYALLTLHQGTGEGLYITKDTMFGMGTAKDLGKTYARWKGIYGASADLTGNLDLGGVLRVNSLNTIDQSNASMSLFNFGARATKSFNAYGTGINFRACDSNGDQVNILAINATKIQAGSDIIPNYTAGLNLGGSSSTTRWATIYGVDANLSGDLSMTQSSHIDIGPLRIEYDATNKALHITKKDGNDTNTYGLYADGFVSSGGVGQTS